MVSAAGLPPGGSLSDAGGAPTSTKKARKGPIVLAVIVALAVLGGAAWFVTRSDTDSLAGDDWRTYDTTSGRFQVELPGQATRLQEERDLAGITFPLTALVVGDGAFDRLAPGAFFVEVDVADRLPLDALAADPATVRTVLEAQARAVFAAAGIEWAATREADFDAGPAIHLDGTVAADDLAVRSFVALDGTSVIGAVVIQPSGDAATAATMLDRIVASLS